MSKFIIYFISPESFKNVDFWLKEVRNYSNPDILIFLIGNKSDLEEKYIYF
jgi:GTPase SAR1 family protein